MSNGTTVAASWKPPVTLGKFAMWVFLGTEIMFFTGLIGTYIVFRIAAGADWPDPAEVLNVPVTAFNTFVLICSSVTMVKALEGFVDGQLKKGKLYLLATILLGAFFVGVQVFEYYELIVHRHFLPSTDIFGSTFYTMTGFHGAHVIGGVIWLICVAVAADAGKVGQHNASPIEIAGLYWHFVDLVWIILFTIVYLM